MTLTFTSSRRFTRYLWRSRCGFFSRKSWIRERAATWTPDTTLTPLQNGQLQTIKKVKVAHMRLPSVGFRSRAWFLAVSLQVTWIINPTVGCHYFPPGLQLSSQPLRGLLPILLLGEQRHNGCEQFAYNCYPTVSRLQFEPRPFWAWVQHANHSATEPPLHNIL